MVQLARQPEPDGATRWCNQQMVQPDGVTSRRCNQMVQTNGTNQQTVQPDDATSKRCNQTVQTVVQPDGATVSTKVKVRALRLKELAVRLHCPDR